MVTKAMWNGFLLCLFASIHSAVAAPKPDPPDSRDVFFANHTIPRIRIRLEEEALAALRNKFREYTKATVMEGRTPGATWVFT